MPDSVIIEGAHVEIVDGVVRATGGVRIEGPDGLVIADQATYDLATRQIVGDGVLVTVCDCPGPDPWSVQAGHAELVPGESVRFRDAWLRVLDRRVVPIPAGSVPLARRSGLLLPSAAYFVDGLRVAQPVYLTLGPSADATVTPEIRSKRGPRLLVEHRYATRGGGGVTSGAAGYDWLAVPGSGVPRGGLDWQHHDGGRVGYATIGRLTSDPDVPRDYGDSFLARRTPWNEARALVWAGPVELSADVFQPASSDLATLDTLALGVRPGAVRAPGGVIVAGSGTGALGMRAGGAVDQRDLAGGGVLSGDLQLSRPTRLGPVRVTPSLAAAGGLATAGAPALAPFDPPDAIAGSFEAVALAWRAGDGGGVQRVELGAVARETYGEAGLVPTIGPVLRWRAAGPRGTTGLTVTADHTGAAALDAWADRDGFSAWSHVGGDADAGLLGTSWLGLAGQVGPVRTSATWLYADVAHQAAADVRWRLPGVAAPVTLGAAGRYDVAGEAFLSRQLSVRYDHPTGCLALGVNARFDVDRALPDVGLVFEAGAGRP